MIFNVNVIACGQAESAESMPPRFWATVETVTGKRVLKVYADVPIAGNKKYRLRATSAGMTLEPR